ncbi:hypothetical protein HDU91_003591 [Kappamyces sp. JEL0680]|nr:hypothetical protein HDU91_003591 [Kappamyces sp. JEL0680]
MSDGASSIDPTGQPSRAAGEETMSMIYFASISILVVGSALVLLIGRHHFYRRLAVQERNHQEMAQWQSLPPYTPICLLDADCGYESDIESIYVRGRSPSYHSLAPTYRTESSHTLFSTFAAIPRPEPALVADRLPDGPFLSR